MPLELLQDNAAFDERETVEEFYETEPYRAHYPAESDIDEGDEIPGL